MSKKKHPEHVNHERWLVSYADFITLLFAFFVVLFAAGQSDKLKQQKLAHALQSAFTSPGIFDPHAQTPSLTEEGQGTGYGVPKKPIELPNPTAEKLTNGKVPGNKNGVGKASVEASTEDRVTAVIKKEIGRKRIGEGAITMHLSDDGLVISLKEAGFFASGSAEVRPGAQDVLAEVAAALPNQAIHVEGHTDNVPIHTAQFATNWELSTARAATVTRIILAAGVVSPKLISATGYAEFQPAADNSTEEGRMKNRRVDVIVLKRPESSQ